MKNLPFVAASIAIVSILGCATDFTSTSLTPLPASGTALRGTVHGGQQLLTNSRVYLFAAGNTGYGSASTSLLRTSASRISTDGSGNGYVTTDGGGGFSISGDWSCVNASDQLYLLAVGGNPGLSAGTNNTAITMLDALGTCSTINSSTFIIVNEAGTVAAATALQQFYLNPTHIGSSAANSAGLAVAFATAANMVDIANSGARAITRGGNGTVPQAAINTLANILAACVNSSGAGSTPCAALFLFSTPSGAAASDTLTAAVNIALNPTRNVGSIFSLSPASPPFQPVLAVAPDDFTLGISYTLGAAAALPGSIAIDALGNVWISSRPSQNQFGVTDTVIKLSSTGNVLSGSGFTDGGFVNLPEGIAVDDTGAVWIANTSSTILKLNNDGTNATGFPYFGADYPQDIALDRSGRAWISNFGSSGFGNTVTLLTGSGSLVSTITPPNFNGGQGISIDAFNNVWVAGQISNNLVEIGSDFTIKSGTGSGFTGGGLSQPAGLGIDANQNVWAANSFFGSGSATLSQFANSGKASSTSSGYTVSTQGYVNILAIDGAGTAWAAVCGANCVGQGAKDSISHTSASGNLLNTPGFLNPTLATPQAVAIDASGNLWVGNAGDGTAGTTGTVTELVGVAAPVKTPIQAALKGNLLGQRP